MMRGKLLFILLLIVEIFQFVYCGILVQDTTIGGPIVEDETSTIAVDELLLNDLIINYTEIVVEQTTTLPPGITTLYSDSTIEATLKIEPTSNSTSSSAISFSTATTPITIAYNTTSLFTNGTSPFFTIGTSTQLPTTADTTSSSSITDNYDETTNEKQIVVTSTEYYETTTKKITKFRVGTKKHRKCKHKIRTKSNTATNRIYPLRNPHMIHEETYVGRHDPWRHVVFKCWMYDLCY